MKTTLRTCAFFLLLAALGAGATQTQSAVLLSDDYRAMTPGMISPGVIGARTEYHYLPAVAPKGNWTVSAFRSDPSQRAWRLIEENGERLIWQSYTETDRDRPVHAPDARRRATNCGAITRWKCVSRPRATSSRAASCSATTRAAFTTSPASWARKRS